MGTEYVGKLVSGIPMSNSPTVESMCESSTGRKNEFSENLSFQEARHSMGSPIEKRAFQESQKKHHISKQLETFRNFENATNNCKENVPPDPRNEHPHLQPHNRHYRGTLLMHFELSLPFRRLGVGMPNRRIRQTRSRRW